MDDKALNRIVGRQLRMARKACGLTQAQLARRVGRSAASIAYFEQGRRAVSPAVMAALCEALDKTPCYFFDRYPRRHGEFGQELSRMEKRLASISRELQRAEQRAKAAAYRYELFEQAFSHLEEAVNITTPDGTVVYANAASERLHGYERGQMEGRNVRRFMVAIEDGREPEGFARLKREGKWSGWVRKRARDGHEFEAHMDVRVIYDHVNRVMGIIGVTKPAEPGRELNE